MKSISLLLLFILSFLGALQVKAQTGEEVPELAGVDTAVEAFMAKWGVPGGSVAITYQGRLVYARGFGMVGVPVEPSHVLSP